MIKTKISSFLLIALLFTLQSCLEDEKNNNADEQLTAQKETSINSSCPTYLFKAKENNLNVSILLDLSDRIEEPGAIEKDTAYLSSLSRAFVAHVKTKKLVMLEDRIQLFFHPVPSNNAINEIAKKLKVSFSKDKPQELLQATEKMYSLEPVNLYDLAQKDAKGVSENYPGSDIWRFFKDNVEDYTISNCHRNILVILTDGYMYFEKTQMKEGNRTSYLTPKSLSQLKLKKSNWKEEMEQNDIGFIPAAKNLDNLEVLVIGINSLNDDNPYAQDIIEAYWSKWFIEMGIPQDNFKIKNAEIATNIEMVINDFINR